MVEHSFTQDMSSHQRVYLKGNYALVSISFIENPEGDFHPKNKDIIHPYKIIILALQQERRGETAKIS
jgi:hypothetical protein